MKWYLRMTPEDYWDRHPDIALAADDGEIRDYGFNKKADAVAFIGAGMKKVCAGCYHAARNGYIYTLVSDSFGR